MEIKGLPITTEGNPILSAADVEALTSESGVVSLMRARTLGEYGGRLFAQNGHSSEEAVDAMTGLVMGLNTPGYQVAYIYAMASDIIESRTRSAFEDETKISANYGGNQ